MKRTVDPLPGIAAKHETTCPRCPDPILFGDRVVFQRGVYLHCRCASGADDE